MRHMLVFIIRWWRLCGIIFWPYRRVAITGVWRAVTHQTSIHRNHFVGIAQKRIKRNEIEYPPTTTNSLSHCTANAVLTWKNEIEMSAERTMTSIGSIVCSIHFRAAFLVPCKWLLWFSCKQINVFCQCPTATCKLQYITRTWYYFDFDNKLMNPLILLRTTKQNPHKRRQRHSDMIQLRINGKIEISVGQQKK